MEKTSGKFEDMPPVVELYSDKRAGEGYAPHEDSNISDASGKIDESITLTIEDIHYPALLINKNLEIEWINSLAEEQLFDRKVSSITDREARNILKLFFGRGFREYIQNWEEIIETHIRLIEPNFPKNQIENILSGLVGRDSSFFEKIHDTKAALRSKMFQNIPLDLTLQDGSVKNYSVHTMSFREGIFFVYLPSDRLTNDITNILANRQRIIHELLQQRLPSLVSLCVLVADLQNSVKISAELLPGEYFKLINQMRKKIDGVVRQYDAIYGKHAGDGILYYFIKKSGTNYITDALNAALQLKQMMKEFSNEWKMQKGWADDLFLNIGIDEGQEFFGTVSSESTLEFTALGDTINYAGRLSDFAHFGSIWVTKNVINKLVQEELEKFHFGVYKKEHERTIFIQNSFSRVMDLLDEDERKNSKFMDIATLPITEIC